MQYLSYTLEDANHFSKAVFECVKFEKGEFYAFFYKEINNEELYAFKSGGVGGSVKDRIAYLIQEEMQQNLELTCLFDDAGATYKAPYNDPLFLEAGIHYLDEVYYCVTPQITTKKLLDTCLYASESTWHSLCLLSTFTLSIQLDQSIYKEDMEHVVDESQLILFGAYDGESYIFWKKNNFSPSNSISSAEWMVAPAMQSIGTLLISIGDMVSPDLKVVLGQ